MGRIYFDHAATTPLDPEVFRVMEAFLREDFGNPSSTHSRGRDVRSALDQARNDVAGTIGADPREIIFTSGGTEGANAVLKGVAWVQRAGRNHLVVSSVEHSCVLESAEWLSKNGFQVTYVPVDAEGRVDPSDVASAIRRETFLVSCTAANHEVGTLQPIREIAKTAREKGALFHTDAVQAYGKVPLHVEDGFDYLTASAHKFYGPKGAGFLYQRKDAPLVPLLHGGVQERGRRAGTENVPAIVGMSEAAVRAAAWMKDDVPRLEELVTVLVEGLKRRLPDLVVNGPYDNNQAMLFDRGSSDSPLPPRRAPGIVNIRIPGFKGDDLAHALDTKGFAVSAGPACSSGGGASSRTLTAMGRDKKAAREGLRISFGRLNTEAEARQLVEVLPLVVERLRMLSPFLGD